MFQDSEEPKIDEENKAEAEAHSLLLSMVRIASSSIVFRRGIHRKLLLSLFHQAPEKKEEKKVHNLWE